jgi:hypothetical protein
MIAGLQAKGYRFVLLKDYLTDNRSRVPDRNDVRPGAAGK